VIAYEIAAAEAGRPWLTLVHGFSQNRRYFAPALPYLKPKFRLLLVDLRAVANSLRTPQRNHVSRERALVAGERPALNGWRLVRETSTAESRHAPRKGATFRG